MVVLYLLYSCFHVFACVLVPFPRGAIGWSMICDVAFYGHIFCCVCFSFTPPPITTTTTTTTTAQPTIAGCNGRSGIVFTVKAV